MEPLNEQQVERVYTALCGEKTANRKLTEDLLDHICTAIELRLGAGADFEDCLKAALMETIPNGIGEIEEELELMLNFKPLTAMKRVFYLSTFVTAFALIFSLLCRHWHMAEWSSISLLVGNLALLLFVLPSVGAMAARNKVLLATSDIVRVVVGLFAGAAVSVGMIFKVFHFPYANLLFSIGTLTLLFLFLPMFFWQLYKRTYV